MTAHGYSSRTFRPGRPKKPPELEPLRETTCHLCDQSNWREPDEPRAALCCACGEKLEPFTPDYGGVPKSTRK